jgi:serine/threonine-protein kinase
MSSEGSDPSASGSGAEVDPLIGQIIDKRYQLTRKLGEGGMGEVYAADHLRIARSVAIKLLRPEVLTNEEAVKRFEQEAMTASSIGHENIIRIEDSGKLEDGRIYLAMELLDGLPFNDLIDQPTPIPPHRLLNILIQTCHGLAAAHNKNIVHRDMKPENIYITQGADGSDLPKLLDFGIAKVSQAEGENHLTRTGTIFGTPFYMAPEQALGQTVDHRVDVYAMGVIMYEVFCGVVPFGGESFMGILTQHITAEPVLPSQTAAQHGRTLPPGVEDVIVKSMKKDPPQRYQTMDELVDALIPIYRGLAGAGMSTYMEAHTPDPSQMRPAVNPTGQAPLQHQTGPAPQHQSGGYGGSGPTHQHNPAHDTGQPHQAPRHQAPPQMGTAPPPNTGGQYGTNAGGSYAGASDSFMVPARKSRAGLFIALFLVICAGGGAAAYFLFMQGGSDDETDPVAANDVDYDAASAVATETPDAAGAGATTDPINTVTGPTDAGAAAVAAVADAQTAAVVPVDPPKAKLITVLIESRPPGASVWLDGKRLGKTSMNVRVTKGESVTYVLKHRKHKETPITIDGSETKVTSRLIKKNRGSDKPPIDKPPIDKPPIDKPPRDPCKRNPNLPECMLE